jgi:hypothetical protein
MDILYVNVFIPTKLFRSPKGLILGYYRKDNFSFNVNITAMASIDLISKNNYDSGEISILGSINGNNDEDVLSQQFWCRLEFKENELLLKSCTIDGIDIEEGIVTLIHYDTRDFMSSQLFGREDNCDDRYFSCFV